MLEKPFPAYDGDQPYFFVSYAHDDSDAVYAEMRWLHDTGFNLWYDDGIHVGSVWRQSLADALSGAAAMVFFATERSTQSSNCLQELNFILDEEKPIFVVQIDDAPLPSLLRLSLSDRQALVKSEFEENDYRGRLSSALSTIVAPTPRSGSNEAPSSSVAGIETNPPAIAILPVVSLSSDEELRYLGEGISGDLTARMSQRIWHIVAGQPDDNGLTPQQVGEIRNVRYVLSGVLQRGGERFRLTMRFSVVADGREAWARRIERVGDDLLEIQDQMVNSIDYELFEVVMSEEARRLRDVPDAELDAWGLCARSRMPVVDAASRDRVRSLIELAIARDPDFAFARALFANLLTAWIYSQFSRDPEGDAKVALQHANRALALAPNNIVILLHCSLAHRVLGDREHALHLAERATDIGGQTSFPHCGALVALERFKEVVEIANGDVDIGWPGDVVVACLALGKAQQALDWARRGTSEYPQNYLSWAYLACAQAANGKEAEAREPVERVRAIIPKFTVDKFEKGARLSYGDNDNVVEPVFRALREYGIQ